MTGLGWAEKNKMKVLVGKRKRFPDRDKGMVTYTGIENLKRGLRNSKQVELDETKIFLMVTAAQLFL